MAAQALSDPADAVNEGAWRLNTAMRYHEIVEAAEITPGFKKSKKIVLADGRTAIMTIKHRPEDPAK